MSGSRPKSGSSKANGTARCDREKTPGGQERPIGTASDVADLGAALRATASRVSGPAFVTSELREAFVVGFLVFVPFLVVDMVVANHAKDSFGKDDNRATLVTREGAVALGVMDKREISDRILDQVKALWRP